MNHANLRDALGRAGASRTGLNAGSDHRGQVEYWTARKGDLVVEWKVLKRGGKSLVDGFPRARRIDDMDIPGDYTAGMMMRTIKSCVRWMEKVEVEK
jgi:hypothetical protein